MPKGDEVMQYPCPKQNEQLNKWLINLKRLESVSLVNAGLH